MKLDEAKTSNGVFIVDNKSYPGQVSFLPENSVEIIITSSNHLFGINFKGKYISVIQGSIKEPSNRITILNGFIYESFISSNGIIEYTIKSNLVILGQNIPLEEKIEISNLHMICADLSQYIGNSLVKTIFHINDKIADVTVPYQKILGEFKYDHFTVKFEAINNIDKYSTQRKIVIEQINSIVIEYENPIDIYSSTSMISNLETFLSFIFQKDCSVNEVVYYSSTERNGHVITDFNHIYFKHRQFSKTKYDDRKVLYKPNYLLSNICEMFGKWCELLNEIKYLRYFMLSYFLNKYVDQKIVAQVNVLEAIYNNCYETVKDNSEINESINRIIPQIADENDQELIANLLSSNIGIGLRRKLLHLSIESGVNNLDKKIIEMIVKIRSAFSHGGVISDIETDKYTEINEKLNEIITAIIMKKIGCGST